MDTAAETQLLDIAPADVLQNLGQLSLLSEVL